ncbi:aspartoacylase [Synechocystis salina]|uniref:Probable aspartoacylase n=1 Tax=Synechocystis salina LEGE 00031 TaxID=1828736 RepID=A0ABR9VN77_9SYNC|nr:aspartoacylase [Synechocystis salina]MBE9241272.1 aspartoacylase [Synechocystis salina LEGE 00041]MBE9252784.1 aspartoacylase [Synechocystis salina LEGE 00031]
MINSAVRSLAIVGGVHGNERTGVEVVRRWQEKDFAQYFPALKCHYFLANPRAIAANRRYIHQDLNRCFRPQDRKNPYLMGYEQLRARQLAHQISLAGIDFIVDLHTTTAAMGTTLILNCPHPLLLNLAAHLSAQDEEIRVLQYAPQKDLPYIRGLCELGLTIEFGPVPQGVYDQGAIAKTQRTLTRILAYLQALTSGNVRSADNCTVYQQIETIDYPRDAQGQIVAEIAPHIRDYQAIKPGTPLFYHRRGNVTPYRGASTVYPVFIGEAAYVEKGIAMALTQRKTIAI